MGVVWIAAIRCKACGYRVVNQKPTNWEAPGIAEAVYTNALRRLRIHCAKKHRLISWQCKDVHSR